MKRLHLSVAAIGLVVLSVGAWWWQHRTPPAPAAAAAPAAPPAAGPVPVEVARAVARDLTDDTTAVGSLRSRQGGIVRPEVSGRVVKLGFRDGERVQRGQVLVQFAGTSAAATNLWIMLMVSLNGPQLNCTNHPY